MKLSLFSDYSLRVLMYAAVKEEAFQLNEVAEAYGISRHHLAKVAQRLAGLGDLITARGRGGGVRLAKPADQIRIGRLVRQTEDQPAIVECFDAKTNTCMIGGSCRLKGALAEAMNAFYESLDRFTLESLVAGPLRGRLAKMLLAGGTT